MRHVRESYINITCIFPGLGPQQTRISLCFAFRQLNCSWPGSGLRTTRKTRKPPRRKSSSLNMSKLGSWSPQLRRDSLIIRATCWGSYVLGMFRIIKTQEALSEIMQDFKYDSEEGDWQLVQISSVSFFVLFVNMEACQLFWNRILVYIMTSFNI